MTRLLLDTHVLLWWGISHRSLPTRFRELLASVSPQNPVLIADVSVLELACLAFERKIEPQMPLREWLDQLTAPPLIERIPIIAAVAEQVVKLPRRLHKDPADRIIMATALAHGATLVTCDRQIISSKIVPTV